MLVVDDQEPIHRFLGPALIASGFDVLTAQTGQQALQLISTAAPDIIVLDLTLPDMDGKELIAELRHFSETPIVVLSERDRESEKIAALDLGADDYVEKPFAYGELMARLRAVLRRSRSAEKNVAPFEIDDLKVDLAKRSVRRNGEGVHLTPKEYTLLSMLARHAGGIVSHRQILASIWGPEHGANVQILRVFVGKLRVKIEKDPARPKIIVNVPGIGYRLNIED